MDTQKISVRELRTIDDYGAFYEKHADRYAFNQIAKVQRIWKSSSHTQLRGNHSLINTLVKLAPGPKGLDAGCGAGAVDVADLVGRDLDVVGIDAVRDNVEAALRLHPFLEGRVQVGDLSRRMAFRTATFDFVMCNAVIQHLSEDHVYDTTLPELCRITKPGGVLQLVFKCGRGTVTIHDPDYDDVRSFRLYDEQRVLESLRDNGMELVAPNGRNSLGGLMYYVNNNSLRHCAFWMRKAA